ncbi:hypothetical protein [Campylobacter lanienae]|nr:hypothetical protein [Campylobacter lanienae]
MKNLEALKKRGEILYKADGRDAHTPYTQAQSLDGRLVQKNISSATIAIVSHNVKYDENDCNKPKNKNIKLEL